MAAGIGVSTVQVEVGWVEGATSIRLCIPWIPLNKQ